MKIFLIIFSAVAVTSLLLLGNKLRAFAATGVSGHKIIIDAGHGGSDPGTTQCSGLYEKDANLLIAKKLESLLKSNGATVYMTRSTDVYMTNADRYNYANKTDGEVLLSIHLNGSTDHSINGTQGLYSKPKKDKVLTSIIHNQLVADLGIADKGITNFMSGVILKYRNAATIQESVYLSNTQECDSLKNSNRADVIAQSLFNGLNNYFAN